jgi:hypothetical protein
MSRGVDLSLVFTHECIQVQAGSCKIVFLSIPTTRPAPWHWKTPFLAATAAYDRF